MHELALSTTEFTNVKGKYVAHRPRGSCVVHISPSMKRRKWLEIICDFAHPRRRHEFDNLKNPIPNWDLIKQFWTHGLYDEWRAADMPSKGYPNGRLITDRAHITLVWESAARARGLEDDMGNDPRGDVKVTDTWLFSSAERKKYLILADDSADDSESDKFPRHSVFDDDDAEVGTVLRPYITIDYRKDLGLTQRTIDAVADPEIQVHPKFNSPVKIDKIKKVFDMLKARTDIVAKFPGVKDRQAKMVGK